MEPSSNLTDALLAAGIVVIFFCVVIWCLYRAVVWARRRSKRAYIIGAALAPLMALGMVIDPDMRIVQEAKRLKKREEDNPGDPPESEEERIVSAAREIAAQKGESIVRESETSTIRAKTSRPALVFIISVTLGLVAAATALMLTWILLAGSAVLDPAALARDSLSALDWSLLFAASALLLTSMVMLFRLRKSSLYWFGAYLTLGALASVWYVLTPEREPYFDVRVTSFSALPVAVAVLLYMLRLKRRTVLA
jgi:hypothetical protein